MLLHTMTVHYFLKTKPKMNGSTVMLCLLVTLTYASALPNLKAYEVLKKMIQNEHNKAEKYEGDADIDCSGIMCDWIPLFCVDSKPYEGCCTTFICPLGNTCWIGDKMISGYEITPHEDDALCSEFCSCPDPFSVHYDDNTQAECATICA